jgi:AMP-polyphosphate phosphotransferase
MKDKETKSRMNAEIQSYGLELARLQRAAQAAQLPIVIVVEGWEAAGKGTLIGRLALSLDSRGYRVVSVRPVSEQEPLYPALHRFWVPLPEKGRITIFDRSWYSDLWAGRALGRIKRGAMNAELLELHAFEQTLVDSGILVVKFFLQIDQAEQAKRFRKLKQRGFTRWRLDDDDLVQNRDFHKRQKVANEIMLADASAGAGAFVVCPANDKHVTQLLALKTLTKAISERLEHANVPPASIRDSAATSPGNTEPTPGAAVLQPLLDVSESRVDASLGSPLARVDLSQSISREQYDKELPELQARLHELEHRIYEKRIPVVISCEGWDAAGKGGAIRRLVAGLDPRGYDVHPISAPNSTERQRHYLWRFWTRIPKGGHIAIFDRTWYGRVLVERVEGFCSETEWRRAYGEIAAFEQALVRYGTVLVKFWFHIDADTQIARFRDRQSREEKQWKITDEDWRNRERWADYESAVNDMLTFNNSADCPYWVVPANDKLFARIFTLRTVISAIEQELARRKDA